MGELITSPAYDVAQYLHDQKVGTLGEDLFVGLIPIDKSPAIGVFDAGGIRALPLYQRDEMLIRFQVLSGVYAYNEGYNLCNDIKETLLGCKGEPLIINEKNYILFTLVGDISALGVDDNNYHRFSLNIRCIRDNFPSKNRLPF